MIQNVPSIYNQPSIYNGGGGAPGDVIEVGDKSYPVVKIGSQAWTSKNLEYEGPGLDSNPGDYSTNPAVYYNCYSIWGVGFVYNHYAGLYIQSSGILPDGWRVPLLDDYLKLFNYVGGNAEVPNKLYSKIWHPASSDEYGLDLRPGGSFQGTGIFSQGIDFNTGVCSLLTRTDAVYGKEYNITCYPSSIQINYNVYGAGRSIRLVKDL